MRESKGGKKNQETSECVIRVVGGEEWNGTHINLRVDCRNVRRRARTAGIWHELMGIGNSEGFNLSRLWQRQASDSKAIHLIDLLTQEIIFFYELEYIQPSAL